MESPVVFFNEEDFNAAAGRLRTGATHLQSLINFYNTLVFRSIELEEVQQLFQNPVVFIYDRMHPASATNEHAAAAGFEIDKEKEMERLKKPEWYGQLLTKIDDVRQFFLENGTHPQKQHLPLWIEQSLTSYYQFNAAEQVEVIPDRIEAMKEHFEERAQTDEVLKVLDFMPKFEALVTDTGILEISNKSGRLFYDFLEALMPYSMLTKQIKVDERALRSLNRKRDF
jgi:hypothetical protein